MRTYLAFRSSRSTNSAFLPSIAALMAPPMALCYLSYRIFGQVGVASGG